MFPARIPSSTEAIRLEALQALQILDTPAERAFDALAASAARLLDCPMGLVTMIDARRQWFKAAVGLDIGETVRDIAFCDHTIRDDGLLVVDDASIDARFSSNPLVCGDGGIRFYAGVPLHAPDPFGGSPQRVGALCVADRTPRSINPDQRAALQELGAIADALLAARNLSSGALDLAQRAHDQAGALRRSDLTFRQAERMAEIGSWRYTIATGDLEWSEGVFRIHELTPGQVPPVEEAIAFYPQHHRGLVRERFERAVKTGAPFRFETDFITAKGKLCRVRSMGEVEMIDGSPGIVFGLFQDITDRYQMEQRLRRLATTDELTGIPNRAAFNHGLEKAIGETRVDRGPLLLLMTDLDHFKAINDNFGHDAGDDVLRTIGARLQKLAQRHGGAAARLGGDEFALVFREPAKCKKASELAAQVLADLSAPVESSHGTLMPGVTVGYALFDPKVHATQRDFTHAADSALYEAKRAQRGTARGAAPFGRRAGE